MRDQADALARLMANRAQYDDLAAAAAESAARGDADQVLRRAAAAAYSAWYSPIGIVNDPALERLVVRAVGCDAAPATVDAQRERGHVLHVLTEGYVTGGHTRLAYRWIERDPRTCDIALTNQRMPVPQPLRDAAEMRGGRLYDLREASSGLTARAETLRALMDQADLVVLHVHPYDTVALAAANLPGLRPPVIFENHADHNYWLGLGAADVVMDHRAVAQRLSHELRGVRPERLGLLPLPIAVDEVPDALRRTTRERLRVSRDDVVALSVAAPHKMRPVWGAGFDTLLNDALAANPRLIVLLVGPSQDERWNSARVRYPQRAFHLGTIETMEPLWAAADIYLDSYPVSSGTSILEAAGHGLPLVSLQSYRDHQQIYHANSPGLDGTGHARATRAEYLQALRRLVNKPALRREQGAAARAAVLEVHDGAAWADALERLYAQARTLGAASLAEYDVAVEDLDYGARLVRFVQGDAPTIDVATATSIHADLAGDRPVGDLHDTDHGDGNGDGNGNGDGDGDGDGARTLALRVEVGWEDHPAWVLRLVRLSKRYPHLAVSLPFSADDDGSGASSVTHLSAVLAVAGLDVDSCGDLTLDAASPTLPGPTDSGVLPLTGAGLDLVEAHLAASNRELAAL